MFKNTNLDLTFLWPPLGEQTEHDSSEQELMELLLKERLTEPRGVLGDGDGGDLGREGSALRELWLGERLPDDDRPLAPRDLWGGGDLGEAARRDGGDFGEARRPKGDRRPRLSIGDRESDLDLERDRERDRYRKRERERDRGRRSGEGVGDFPSIYIDL